VLPARLTEAVASAKARSDAHTSSFEQLTLAEFITSGAYDRHVRRVRLAYRRRRDRLVAALAAHAPGVRVTGIAAGLHAVLDLPGAEAERQLITRAARHGLALQGLDSFRAPGSSADRAGLVIGYGRPPDHAYTTALARLCAVLDPEAARLA
jgi:GntR family transcriptional regulator/MocR family aminotransferase